MQKFDEKVTSILKKDINSRISIILHDASYIHSVNSNISREPRELYALRALLKIVADRVHMDKKVFQNYGITQILLLNLTKLCNTFKILFNSFNQSFQTPQLLEVAAMGILDLVELVFLVNKSMISAQVEISRYYIDNNGLFA